MERALALRDAGLLAEWRATEAYDAWKRHYDRLLDNAVQDVLTADRHTFELYQGRWQGIKKVGDLVDQVLGDADLMRRH